MFVIKNYQNNKKYSIKKPPQLKYYQKAGDQK